MIGRRAATSGEPALLGLAPIWSRCLMTDVLTSPPEQRLHRRRARIELGRQLCRYHAAPLLAMAVLILKDSEAATKIVVDTIVGASLRRGLLHPGDGRVRTALASSVYRRCLGALVLRERFGLPGPVPIVSDAVAMPRALLNDRQRSAMAVALFGGGDLNGVARILGLAPANVLRQLEEVLSLTTATTTQSVAPSGN
jgi:hypothetical protein